MKFQSLCKITAATNCRIALPVEHSLDTATITVDIFPPATAGEAAPTTIHISTPARSSVRFGGEEALPSTTPATPREAGEQRPRAGGKVVGHVRTPSPTRCVIAFTSEGVSLAGRVIELRCVPATAAAPAMLRVDLPEAATLVVTSIAAAASENAPTGPVGEAGTEGAKRKKRRKARIQASGSDDLATRSQPLPPHHRVGGQLDIPFSPEGTAPQAGGVKPGDATANGKQPGLPGSDTQPPKTTEPATPVSGGAPADGVRSVRNGSETPNTVSGKSMPVVEFVPADSGIEFTVSTPPPRGTIKIGVVGGSVAYAYRSGDQSFEATFGQSD